MSNCRVLVADDEERICQGLKILLTDIITGFDVVAIASNGKTAYELAVEKSVDLIITDIRMPKMNGLEFIQNIKSVMPEVPIIILSGYYEYENMRKAIQYGVADYIRKPIDRIEFTRIVSKYKKEEASYYYKDEKEQVRRLIKHVFEIIDQRLHEDVSLQEIAREVKYSYNHLSYVFKNETGMNFSDYIIRERMEKAKKLLSETELKIYEISCMCGYNNPKYFMKAFKECVKCTPSEFRDKS